MCQVKKYMHSLYKKDHFFSVLQTQHQLRGHSKKLEKKFCSKTLRQQLFSIRVVSDWNNLLEDMISTPSLPDPCPSAKRDN